MRETALEAALITEHPNGYATLALNDDLISSLDQEEKERLLRGLFVLTRGALSKDLEQCPKDKAIAISPDPAHSDFIMQLRMLMADDGHFSLLTYFGGRANTTTPLAAGLAHALEVVMVVEDNTF